MVNAKKITHERLGRWEKKLVDNHATPALLLGIGHDHVKGQLNICVTEEMSDRKIILLLQGAIAELQKNNS